jgi:DNA-directed RNA polymerase specialized sigma24 family protein
MNDQAPLTPPDQDNAAAALQERTRAFTSFYEQHAYLAYNLALRIACAAAPAANAVQTAFLRQLEDRPDGLVPATVTAALRDAASPVEPEVAGGPESQALLQAISQLAPAERAALAMADLANAGPEEIGETIGVPGDQATNLLRRAREAFAAAAGLSPALAQDAAADWMWAAPPNEIWEELYQRFHRTAERQVRGRDTSEQTLILRAQGGGAPAKATRAAKRRLRRGPGRGGRLTRRLRSRRTGVVAAVLLAGVAIAATQLSSSNAGSGPGGPTRSDAPAATWGDPTPADSATGDDAAAKPHKPLTAALLDKLRLRELRQLRAYSKRQSDSSLPARERRAAARRVTAIERAAQQRLRAQQKREAALRDREARQRAQQRAPAPPPAPSSQTPRSPSRPTPPRSSQPQQQAPAQPTAPTRDEADQTCLMDEDSGQYICPH